MKRLSILGSTGSIGRATLDIVRRYPEHFRVVGLAAASNVELMAEQIKSFNPLMVALYDSASAEDIARRFPELRVLSGTEGLIEVATMEEADFVLSAISGSSGLLPTYEAVRAGKTIGLANKETLVMAGELINREAKAAIIPVDSEHSAIFQCLQGHRTEDVRKLILTASGGPFRGMKRKELEAVTGEDALKHPTWQMGRKVTIDSATLMNKGLEVIEAHHLFGFRPEQIDVVIHHQSIVHSMVEFIDGSLIAQLSVPDMRGPIAYALSYPERLPDVLNRCSLSELKTLSFESPDLETFSCLRLCYRAIELGGTAPAVINAADEKAVDAFLKGFIGFNDIPAIIEEILSAHRPAPVETISDVLEADQWARKRFDELMEERV
ncbi:MAG: 1-deoxy-D-xylulose-5-phosphate reductoisomerase [Nitrospirae bacterium]|nr:MAG: 1-deoxy-D-xylulose-5-phosphate reductoisomerase [Nitrospirota bacterium]